MLSLQSHSSSPVLDEADRILDMGLLAYAFRAPWSPPEFVTDPPFLRYSYAIRLRSRPNFLAGPCIHLTQTPQLLRQEEAHT
jgi:hypothetical protein